MKTDLLDLAESENPDNELVPTILPVDARLSVRGPVETLKSLFERAGAISPVKEVISGTGHALLEVNLAKAGELPYVRVSATDGDLTVAMVADGIDVLMPGKALVPGKKIADILKLAPTATAHIEVLGTSATIRSGRAQWTVQTPVGDALPPVPDVGGILTYPVAADGLLEALSVARKAASTSSARASLMQVGVKDGTITGLDGGRLHRQAVSDLPTHLDLSVPLRVVDEMMRMLRDARESAAEFGGNDSHLVLRVDQDTLIAQRLLVPFPDVEKQVLGPALTNSYTLTVERERMVAAVKRVRVNADPDYQSVILTLVPGKMTEEGPTYSLTVSARDRSGNSAQESLDVMWTGPTGARSLTVNHRYLADLLTTAVGEHLTLRIGDDSKSSRMPLFVENTVSGFTGWVQQMRPGYLS